MNTIAAVGSADGMVRTYRLKGVYTTEYAMLSDGTFGDSSVYYHPLRFLWRVSLRPHSRMSSLYTLQRVQVRCTWRLVPWPYGSTPDAELAGLVQGDLTNANHTYLAITAVRTGEINERLGLEGLVLEGDVTYEGPNRSVFDKFSIGRRNYFASVGAPPRIMPMTAKVYGESDTLTFDILGHYNGDEISTFVLQNEPDRGVLSKEGSAYVTTDPILQNKVTFTKNGLPWHCKNVHVSVQAGENWALSHKAPSMW